MENRSVATFDDLASIVHKDVDANDGAIRANINRVNRFLESQRIPLHFRVGAGRVFKEDTRQKTA